MPERTSQREGTEPEAGRPRRRSWTTVGTVILVVVLVRVFVLETFVIPSASMEPSLLPGDRVAVLKVGRPAPSRGDVVVFDGTAGFGAVPRGEGLGAVLDVVSDAASGRPGSSDYVKRVIGVSGDRVRCCAPDGRIVVNGLPIDEPYLEPGDAPSDVSFDVRVPDGRLWLMGDHRSNSQDSRAHLGDPGGGMISVGDVVGPVWFRFWPLDRVGGIDGPGTLRAGGTSADGAAEGE